MSSTKTNPFTREFTATANNLANDKIGRLTGEKYTGVDAAEKEAKEQAAQSVQPASTSVFSRIFRRAPKTQAPVLAISAPMQNIATTEKSSAKKPVVDPVALARAAMENQVKQPFGGSIMHMPQTDRAGFGNIPDVVAQLGDAMTRPGATSLSGIPMSLLITFSSPAAQHDMEVFQATGKLPASSDAATAFTLMLEWLHQLPAPLLRGAVKESRSQIEIRRLGKKVPTTNVNSERDVVTNTRALKEAIKSVQQNAEVEATGPLSREIIHAHARLAALQVIDDANMEGVSKNTFKFILDTFASMVYRQAGTGPATSAQELAHAIAESFVHRDNDRPGKDKELDVWSDAADLKALETFIAYYLEARADLSAGIVSLQGQGQFIVDESTNSARGDADVINRLLNQFSDMADTAAEFRITPSGDKVGITVITTDGTSRTIEPDEDDKLWFAETIASLAQEGGEANAFISLRPLTTVLQEGLQNAIVAGNVAAYVQSNSHALRYLTTLTLDDATEVTDETAKIIAQACPALTELNSAKYQDSMQGGLQYAISTQSVQTFVEENSMALRFLKTLTLRDATNSALSAIAQACPALTDLKIYSEEENLPALAKFAHLNSLSITGKQLIDLKGIENHQKLTSLTVVGGANTNVDAISSIVGLKTLSLDSTRQFKLNMLRDHEFMETLEVARVRLDEAQLPVLKTLPNLKVLGIEGDFFLTNLDAVADHKTLARVTLKDLYSFDSLHWVTTLPELTTLSVEGPSKIADLEIANMVVVEKLSSFIMRTPAGPDGNTEVERNGTRAMVDMVRATLKTKFPTATIVWDWNYAAPQAD